MFENGAEVIRFDCHLHTKADKEFKYNGEENQFVNNYVEKLEEAGIGVGILTNHNKFDEGEYKAIKRNARRKDILILPGVELSMKEGKGAVHVLVVFNPDEWLKNGTNYIQKVLDTLFLNVDNPESENTHCKKDVMTCIRQLNSLNRDYFIIFAHVEQDSGLWKECDGSIITPLANEPEFRERVLGFQKVRTWNKAQIVHNWMGYDIAYVEGSDPKCLDDVGKGTQKTYIKIGAHSFNAVKYALKDYLNRVYKEKPSISHGYIKSMRCVGGKLDGQVLYPSTELNTIIGIRGSGKSSVLEVLRYALNIEPAKPDYEYKNDLVKSVLGSGGQVELQVIDEYKREYLIKRILNESPTIIDEAGKVLNVSVNTVVKNPLYFGQKDLALTRAGYEMELLNKIVGDEALDISAELKDISERLSGEIKKYYDMEDIPARITDISTRNSELYHKLKIYKEKGIDEKLKKQTACNDDLVKLNSIYNQLQETIDSLQRSYSSDNISNISLESYISEFNEEIFTDAKSVIEQATKHVGIIHEQITILKNELVKLHEIRERLINKIDSLKEEFAEIKREINDDKIDVESYVWYQKQLSSNNDEIVRLQLALKEKESIKETIKSLLDERNGVLRKRFCAYEKSILEINRVQNQLQIEIEFKGNREEFKSNLKQLLKGTKLNESKYDELVKTYSDYAAILEDVYLCGGEKLRSICSENAYLRVIEKINESYGEFLNQYVEDLIRINYHGKPLSKHSLGQRASALILFILTQNDSDIIIIDQPEDDLDNQVIYKELIHTIREEKLNMQFIFATHNANIPVLGDAEKVVTAEYDVENAKIALKQGTIDSEETHKSIVDIMEGGEEAFRKRNEIYTTW